MELADDGSGKLSKSLPMLVLQLGRDLPKVAFDRIAGDGGAATMVLYMSHRNETVTDP